MMRVADRAQLVAICGRDNLVAHYRSAPGMPSSVQTTVAHVHFNSFGHIVTYPILDSTDDFR